MKARHKDTGEIIELAEEGIISCDGRRFCWYQVELIPEPIDDFKPSLPSDLDEAAEEYRDTEVCTDSDYIDDDGDSLYRSFALREAFKAGAEWMAGQGHTVDGTFHHSCGYPSVIELKTYLRDYEGADVIVQIRKK